MMNKIGSIFWYLIDLMIIAILIVSIIPLALGFLIINLFDILSLIKNKSIHNKTMKI